MESDLSGFIPYLCGGGGVFLFFVAGVFMIIMNIRARKKAEASQSWPSTTGEVFSTDVKRSTSTDSEGYNTTTYEPVIIYGYNVIGSDYESSKISFGLKRTYNTVAKANQVLENYPKGSAVTVYYNPDNPSEAVLERKVGSKLVGMIIGIVFLFISLCVGLPLLVYFGISGAM